MLRFPNCDGRSTAMTANVNTMKKTNTLAGLSSSIAIVLSLLASSTAASANAANITALEVLSLINSHGCQSIIDQNNHFIEPDGTHYDLSLLQPYHGMLSPNFRLHIPDLDTDNNGAQSHENVATHISRAIFQDMALVQAQNDAQGNIVYVEVRHGWNRTDTFGMQADECEADELLVFTADDLDPTHLDGMLVDLEDIEINDDDGQGDRRNLENSEPARSAIANAVSGKTIRNGRNSKTNNDGNHEDELNDGLFMRRRQKRNLDQPLRKSKAGSVEPADNQQLSAAQTDNFSIPGLPTVPPTNSSTPDLEWIPPAGKENLTDGGDFEWIPVDPDNATDPDRAGDGFRYVRGDGTSEDCAFFKVVKIAIMYDAEFCQELGSTQAAIDRIELIVASASVLYEIDMCVKLQLTDIYTPDSCFTSTSLFSTFHRNLACQNGRSDTFLKSIQEWTNDNRDSIGLDPDATVHAFTGLRPNRIVGCAYVGVVCNNKPGAYGVDYLGTYRNVAPQATVLAHEIGHNLAARHISTNDSNGLRYIMQARLNVPHDGWSQQSVDTILDHLDRADVTCDTIDSGGGTVVVTPSPTVTPTQLPTELPSATPTQTPTSDESKCELKQIADSDRMCTVRTEQPGMYACFTLASIMNAYPDCPLKEPVRVELQLNSCTPILEDNPSNDRALQEASTATSSDDRNRALGEPAPSNDSEPVDCTTPCARVGNSICILAADFLGFRIRFTATTETTTRSFFRTIDLVGGTDTSTLDSQCKPADKECEAIF